MGAMVTEVVAEPELCLLWGGLATVCGPGVDLPCSDGHKI